MANNTRTYDFVLTIITVITLAVIGAVCAYGTLFSYFASKADPNWSTGMKYASYLVAMNNLALPFLLLIIILLVLCIPKRLITHNLLYVAVSLITLAALALGSIVQPIIGLKLIILFAIAVQLYVILKTLQGNYTLFFQKEGKVSQLGSGLLHLGFLLFFYDLIILNKSAMHLTVFWIAAALISIGNVFSFYPNFFKKFGNRTAR